LAPSGGGPGVSFRSPTQAPMGFSQGNLQSLIKPHVIIGLRTESITRPNRRTGNLKLPLAMGGWSARRIKMNGFKVLSMAVLLSSLIFLGSVTPAGSYNCEGLWCTFSENTFKINMINQGAGGAINGYAESNRGVSGLSNTGNGIYGFSSEGYGIYGYGENSTAIYGSGGWDGVEGLSRNQDASGVYGHNSAGGHGVFGYTENTTAAMSAVYGGNNGPGLGVHGVSTGGTGVLGQGKDYGVKGTSAESTGVYGQGRYYGVHAYVSSTFSGSSAVLGENQGIGYGISGISFGAKPYAGAFGQNYGSGYGVRGKSSQGIAGFFEIANPDNTYAALKSQTSGSGWAGAFYGNTPITSRGVYIKTNGGVALKVVGDMVVTGNKSAVVATSQGPRALYAEEASEVYFTEYGFGKLQDGKVLIAIDPLFAETVNLDQPYHVFVQSYGDADLVVSRRTAKGFEVRLRAQDPRGDAAAEFSYRLVAKRRGCEQARLGPVPGDDPEPNLPENSADKLAASQ
jgi:hypothetical protein